MREMTQYIQSCTFVVYMSIRIHVMYTCDVYHINTCIHVFIHNIYTTNVQD